ncbi:MAG: response regulator, partial [Nocardioides sp.]
SPRPTTATSTPARSAPGHLLDQRRALVVCDIAGNRAQLAEGLAGWGMQVDQARDAAEARDRVASSGPHDLVLVDLVMPGRDPIETAAAVHALDRAAAVLLLSPHPLDADALRAAGVTGVLAKPLSRSTLFDRLVTTLAAAHGVTAGGTYPSRLPRSRGRHLLVVEDNEVNQLVALGVLEALGYTADVAVDGLEGVERVRVGEYDAVLMDVQMPRLDGYDATRAIRALPDPARSRVPVVAMTAAAIEGEREKCLAAGMDEFLTKPLDPGLLDRTLDRVLGLATAPGPSLEPETSVAPETLNELVETTSPAGATSRPDLDPGRLDELMEMGDGAEVLVRRAVDNFVAGADRSVAAIRRAAECGDVPGLLSAAHQLKGSAQNLGALAVGEAGLALELLAEAGTTEGAAPLVDRLDAALSRAVTALRAYVG